MLGLKRSRNSVNMAGKEEGNGASGSGGNGGGGGGGDKGDKGDGGDKWDGGGEAKRWRNMPIKAPNPWKVCRNCGWPTYSNKWYWRAWGYPMAHGSCMYCNGQVPG